MKTQNTEFPLQVKRFPILIQEHQGAPWHKYPVVATSWEMAMHRVARDLKPGQTFDIEECPFNCYVPANH
jgi:hypothetical protein